MELCPIVTCEHASNAVPEPYQKLFADRTELLTTHRAVDVGAVGVARDLARLLGVTPHLATWTRLLIELNRSLHHRRLFSELTRGLDVGSKQHLIASVYKPYRDAVESDIAAAIARQRRVLHISVHSFTPVLDGKQRNADIGLLYDPKRVAERAVVDRWRELIATADTSVRVRRNYPYRGDADGLTTHLRHRFAAESYMGIELEMNQQLFESTATPSVVQRVIRAVPTLLAAPA